MNQQQGNHKHTKERNILAVEEGMGIEAGVQQEQQHSEQGEQAVVEQAHGQQVTADPAQQEEQVGQEMTAEIDGTGIFQSQDPLDQQQGEFEYSTVRSVPILHKVIIFSRDVVGVQDSDVTLYGLVPRYAVVIEYGDAD